MADVKITQLPAHVGPIPASALMVLVDPDAPLEADRTRKILASELMGSGGGGGLEWSVSTIDLTTESNKGYLVDTTTAEKIVTLHPNPEVGDSIAVADLKGNFQINRVLINRNGALIQGEENDLILDVKNQRITLVYSGATDGWIITQLEPNSKAVNSGLQTVPELNTTGNVMGFDMSKTGANQITITKGSCLDSTLEVPMAFTADKTVAIPVVANTIYHIFIVKLLSNGSFEPRVYTAEANVLTDVEVDKFRWIGLFYTNGSGDLWDIDIIDGVLYFNESYNIKTDIPFSTAMVSHDLSALVPDKSRVSEYIFRAIGGNFATIVELIRGSTPLIRSNLVVSASFSRPSEVALRMDGTSSTGSIGIVNLKLRR